VFRKARVRECLRHCFGLLRLVAVGSCPLVPLSLSSSTLPLRQASYGCAARYQQTLNATLSTRVVPASIAKTLLGIGCCVENAAAMRTKVGRRLRCHSGMVGKV
jgi:hypothetical protein